MFRLLGVVMCVLVAAAPAARGAAVWTITKGEGAEHSEEGRPVLRLAAASDGASASAYRDFPLATAEGVIEFDAEVRFADIRRGPKQWHEGKLSLQLLDADGQPLGDAQPLPGYRKTSHGWLAVSAELPHGPEARAVRLIASLQEVKAGTLEVADARIRPVSRSEADAWRREAEARIEQHRKGDLAVIVRDAQLQPIPGAQVHVRMRRHAYGWGTAVSGTMFFGADSEDRRKYLHHLATLFNCAVPENELKWPMIHRHGIGRAQEMVTWLRAQGMVVRGHTLVWPSWEKTLPELEALKADPAALRQRVDQHLLTTAAAFRGQLIEWDVVNEPTVHNDLLDVLGEEELVRWFQLARQADPHALLFINDNNVEFNGTNFPEHLRLSRMLKERGAPIDGVGLQLHLWRKGLLSRRQFLRELDAFGALGLRVQITEFDIVNKSSPQQQAELMRDFLVMSFSHPATDRFLMWGFWDGAHWEKNGPLFNADWSLKPSGQAFMDLVFGAWWTDADLVADSAGRASARVIQGDYEVTVRHAGQARVLRAHVPADGHTLYVDFAEKSPVVADQGIPPTLKPTLSMQ